MPYYTERGGGGIPVCRIFRIKNGWFYTAYSVYTYQGCSVRFWEQGFDKVCGSFRVLKQFKGFDVQFWETGPWAPPPTFKSSQLVVNVYK